MGANCCCGVRQKEEERDAGSPKAKVPAENEQSFSLRHLRLHRAALEQESMKGKSSDQDGMAAGDFRTLPASAWHSIHARFEVPPIHLEPRRRVGSMEELTDGFYRRSIHQDPAN
eukprot:symbB.v1.2.041572.t1/scaffold8273.1/size6985/1